MTTERRQQGSYEPPRRTPAYAVTITSTTDSRIRQFQVSRPMTIAAAIVAGIVVLFLTAAGITFGYLLREAKIARVLRTENAFMQRELVRVSEMEGRIAQLEATRHALLELMGVDDVDAKRGPDGTHEMASQYPSGEYDVAEPGAIPDETDLQDLRSLLGTLPMQGPVTREFGLLPDTGVFHAGVDVAGETGAPILSAGEGIVSFVGTDEIFGLVLVVSHSASAKTMYGHASHILVQLGDYVEEGQPIAEVGNTGQSTAPHLHFEVQWQGRAIDPGRVFSDWNSPDVDQEPLLGERNHGS